MKLKHLKVKNFRSIKDASVSFPPAGLIVIDGINYDTDGGSNAAGKTSLVSSIPFCFFGRPLEGGSVKDYVRYGADSMEIEVELDIDGSNLLVKRSLVDFDLFVDGKSLKGLKTALTKEFSYRTGLTYQTIRALFLGQTWESFVDMTPAKRVEALENVFSIFLFSDLLLRTKNDEKAIRTKLAGVEKDISFIEGVLASSKTSYEAKIDEYELKRRELLAKIERKINQVDYEKSILLEQLSKVKEATPDASIDLSELSSLEEKHANLVKQIASVVSQMESLSKELDRYRRKISSLDREVKLLAKDICPLCNQPISDPKIKQQKEKELLEYKRLARETSDKLEELRKKQLDLISKQSVVEQQLAQKRNLLASFQDMKQREQDLLVKIAQLDSKRSQLVEEYKRVQDEENPFVKLEEERKQKFQSALIKHEKLTKKKLTILKDLEIIQVWQNVLKTTRNYLFTQMLKFLETKANEFLTFLSPGLSLNFVFDSSKLVIDIIRDGKSANFKLLSGGEQQLVRLSCLLGLFEVVRHRFTGRVGFLFLDEPLQHLDEKKRSKFFSLLKNLAKDLQVFVIDHHSDFGYDIDMQILVKKRNGVSFVEVL